MIFQFSDGEFSGPLATSPKMWEKIKSFIVIIAFSVTLEKLNTNPQALRAPQYKLKRFVTMTTYWVPDLSNIKGFSGHLWHSILIFANKARMEEGAMASWLVRSTPE